MLKSLVTTFIFLAAANTANAGATHLNHKQTRKVVRLSLWYEGTSPYDKSMFKPGAAEELLKNSADSTPNKPQINEELAVALDNLQI